MLIRCAAEIERVLSLPFSKTSKGHALLWGRGTGCPYVWANGQIRRSHLVVWLDGREIPPGHLVHHEDGDKLNDVPSNLKIISHGEHSHQHASNRSPEWRAKVSAALTGRVLSEESRRKISLAGMGKANAAGKRSPQAMGNLRLAGAKRAAKQREKEFRLQEAVDQLSDEGLSSRKIAEALGISKDRVLRLLRSNL